MTAIPSPQPCYVLLTAFQILRLLEPRDLLNLARTSKPFRELLMSRSSASMWKAARENVEGLPDCPAHLSEPAYANLCFFPYCHVRDVAVSGLETLIHLTRVGLSQAQRSNSSMAVQQAILPFVLESKVSHTCIGLYRAYTKAGLVLSL